MRLFLSSLSEQATTPIVEELVIQGLTYPNPPEVPIDSGGLIALVGNYQYAPQQYRIKDKTFITVMTTLLSRQYIVVFDHYRGMASDLIDTGLDFNTLDGHHVCSIYPNPTDPTKLFMYGIDRGGTKVCRISSCGTNYDVLNWEAWTVIEGADSPERLDVAEYPHWSTASNGDVQGIFRYPTWSAKHLRTSDLINWDRIDIFYLDIAGDKRPYPLGMYPEDSGVIRTFFNYTDFDTNPSGATFPYLLYMESHDEGVTWQNIDNSFSKDVVANGAMYDNEVLNNFTAYQGTWGLGLTKAYTAMILNGRPYAICGWEDTGEPCLIYWDGSEWIINKIKITGIEFAVTSTITGQVITGGEQMFYQAGAIVAYMTEVIGGVGYMCEIRTTDNGLTWSYIEGYMSSNTQIGTYNKMSGKSVLVTKNVNDFWVKEIK